jgi:hypothetical protein
VARVPNVFPERVPPHRPVVALHIAVGLVGRRFDDLARVMVDDRRSRPEVIAERHKNADFACRRRRKCRLCVEGVAEQLTSCAKVELFGCIVVFVVLPSGIGERRVLQDERVKYLNRVEIRATRRGALMSSRDALAGNVVCLTCQRHGLAQCEGAILGRSLQSCVWAESTIFRAITPILRRLAYTITARQAN